MAEAFAWLATAASSSKDPPPTWQAGIRDQALHRFRSAGGLAIEDQGVMLLQVGQGEAEGLRVPGGTPESRARWRLLQRALMLLPA